MRGPVLVRIASRVELSSIFGCWVYRGALRDGYASVCDEDGTTRGGHRIVYERLVGPVPDGLQLDHLCRVRACVNPMHLEPVSNQENARRGVHPQAQRERCPKGHAYDEANTLRHGGRRLCRACRSVYMTAWYQRRHSVALVD